MDNKIELPPKVKKLYSCDCYAEGLTVTYWKDDKTVIVDLWVAGENNVSSMTWVDRFKEIWRILTQGKRHIAEVLLDYKTAHELAEDLKREIEAISHTR